MSRVTPTGKMRFGARKADSTAKRLHVAEWRPSVVMSDESNEQRATVPLRYLKPTVSEGVARHAEHPVLRGMNMVPVHVRYG